MEIESLGKTRLGRFGLLVLVKLNEKALAAELACGDKDSAIVEPDPQVEVPDIDERRFGPGASEPGWWESPYKGGPMVKVEGFPRPMYPPSAVHYPTSPDGPDALAYKRTVSRLGRWPWDPPSWDDSYSNQFAHGKSGNVKETGVAGVQRQQKIDDTGYIGEKTFNALRSAKVPSGPNVGQMAMDSVAVNLINDAYQRFTAVEAKGTPEQAITDYCLRSIKAAHKWHYRQVRPMDFGAAPDDDSHTDDDCSEHSTQCYYWARQETGIAVPDPNGNGYNGYGWTGEQIQNPKVNSPYKVGDLSLYGNSMSDTSHVCICYAPGGPSDSEWCSNGSESAPYAVSLNYRDDLLCVVRPGLTP